jgi:hypothetical protein
VSKLKSEKVMGLGGILQMDVLLVGDVMRWSHGIVSCMGRRLDDDAKLDTIM